MVVGWTKRSVPTPPSIKSDGPQRGHASLFPPYKSKTASAGKRQSSNARGAGSAGPPGGAPRGQERSDWGGRPRGARISAVRVRVGVGRSPVVESNCIRREAGWGATGG